MYVFRSASTVSPVVAIFHECEQHCARSTVIGETSIV
jgi:hypothetical protein